MKFTGKKILFFSTAFFGYENKIIDKLNETGATVVYYNERSVTKAWERALLKLSPNFFWLKTYKYYQEIVNSNKNENYDYIFWNGITMLNKKIVHMIKKAFPDSILIMYLPDSIQNKRWIASLFDEFDKVITFDRMDYVYYKVYKKRKNIYFRPLYYADCYCEKKSEKSDYKYDVCFIGTIHSDRYKIINELKQWSKDNDIKLYTYCYLQGRFVFYIYKLIKKEFRDARLTDFKFNKLDSKAIVDIVKKSKSVIDMQYPLNTGLTMRTIEMLGLNKKLITTNSDVKKYDFYNEDNIYVIDRKCVIFSKKFFHVPYRDVPLTIYEKYSLESWLIDIFEANTPKIDKFMINAI